MTFIGNIIWFIFGGFIHSLGWFLSGILWSITIIGIPYGTQCFKMARLQLAPFGKEVVDRGTTPLNFIANIIWIVFFGWEIALSHLLHGVLLAITIIGLPFAKQHFKLLIMALLPFGREFR